ncbi:poly-beta-1,6-N-acetyl-D-glucosamine synthase [Ectobacillus ponti]|uniref:Poly-beta-1,6-N-acetyl-D-glucosamine synthase n=1 Tax=Ectobacillus ponti TaxID=2961894 RepID=A0AA41X813_9BACI|nr:poly-beta-1,6-N-acetyl-D-glucosamine synthase [Ectobacillus ponti]MCP8968040.1 poly-beta-1,6-N-acetyl-D-glucosamine synthase [Ectobacillus ponti]
MIAFFAGFLFWYPLLMSLFWISGGILFYMKRERKEPLPLTETPLVSILVPCHNEEETVWETVDHLLQLNYPNYEILLINDGSHDVTGRIAEVITTMYPKKVRFIDMKKNSGKANALYMGFLASKGEYLVCVDADALLDRDALRYMIPHFTTANNGERVGAVTGNPRVRNRSSLLSRLQLVEYASIISSIKRTQRILGKVMTVSGVVVAFRKRALLDCGLWDRDMITEDIAVTWKLQKRFWDVRYEPNALCWMLVPETLRGIWKQRVRWAQGGLEVMLRHWDIFLDWRQRRLYPIYMEQVFSLLWSVLWVVFTVLALCKAVATFEFLGLFTLYACVLSVTCIVQFFIAVQLDRRYDEKLARYYLWAVWYPLVYWYVNTFVVVRALPKALFKKKGEMAVWESPDRGVTM